MAAVGLVDTRDKACKIPQPSNGDELPIFSGRARHANSRFPSSGGPRPSHDLIRITDMQETIRTCYPTSWPREKVPFAQPPRILKDMSVNESHPPSAPLKAHYHKPSPRTPPSPLAIATSVVKRLVNEQRTYVLELESQQRRIDKIEKDEEGEGEDGNRSFRLGQEKAGLQETRNVFGPLSTRITEAVAKLDGLIVSHLYLIAVSCVGWYGWFSLEYWEVANDLYHVE